MLLKKIFLAILIGASLCIAQTINIRGIVKDTAGVGIAGATVKLEVANISTTTSTDGSFILIGGSTAIQQAKTSLTMATCPIRLQNCTLMLSLSKNTLVAVSVYDVGGRNIHNSKTVYSSGTHILPSPLSAAGIYLYNVTIGQKVYSLKSTPLGFISNESNAEKRFNIRNALAKQAKASAAIRDIISVTKEGQLNYRDSIKTSDTSGIIVKMIPSAGNVTDVEGNVYQTVQIGNQVWTVENLRTTKYNDGSAIPLVTDSAEWSNQTTPGYCFYNNNTDAAYQEKWGALYNWYMVEPTNPKQIAPTGWRVPSDKDWDTLRSYLIVNGYNWDGSKEDDKIAKALAAKTDWVTYKNVGTVGNDLSKNNRSGFSALPGGYRTSDGDFYDQSYDGYWWSTGGDSARAYGRSFSNRYENLGRSVTSKKGGFSVRLLRDL